MDSITQQKIQTLHPKIRQEVAQLVEVANSKLKAHSQMRIVQAYRSFEEQDALYAQGRTKPGPVVTNAKAGQTYHNYGLAFDFCLIIDGKNASWDIHMDWDKDKVEDWTEVVDVFKAAGYEWGGYWKTFKDNPHLQKLFGHTWHDLLPLYNDAQHTFVDNGYKYVKL